MEHPSITYDGAAIAIVRRLRGYSRRELAEQAGLRAARLADIEQGSVPKPDELTRLWGVLMSAVRAF
jgi:transcriptional regulator with XRE-family HTH domain